MTGRVDILLRIFENVHKSTFFGPVTSILTFLQFSQKCDPYINMTIYIYIFIINEYRRNYSFVRGAHNFFFNFLLFYKYFILPYTQTRGDNTETKFNNKCFLNFFLNLFDFFSQDPPKIFFTPSLRCIGCCRGRVHISGKVDDP